MSFSLHFIHKIFTLSCIKQSLFSLDWPASTILYIVRKDNGFIGSFVLEIAVISTTGAAIVG